MVIDKQRFQQFALAVAPPTAAVANYCDHVEHNEVAQGDWVTEAAEALQAQALRLARDAGLDMVELYADRLQMIESRNVLSHDESFDGREAALAAETWRDLQLVQVTHDHHYHSDVVGLSKAEQLRHYALHLAKIVGAFAEATDEQELLTRRLPDTLLFALKLRTVMGTRLESAELPGRGAMRAVGARV